MPKYPMLLSPFELKHLKLKNRMVKEGSSINLASQDGFVTDDNISFYEAIAKGGIGLIMVEHGFIDYPMGVTGPRRIAVSDDKYVLGLRRLADVIHKHGAACCLQLGHCGPVQSWLLPHGIRPVSSSDMGEKGARALSIEEIRELVQKYALAALRARAAGFDGVEILSAISYLINSFLSLHWNRRDDEYGPQTIENRARFPTEIIRAIREKASNNFVIGARMNFAECGFKNGLSMPDVKQFAKMYEKAGIDFISTQVWGVGDYYLMPYPEQLLFPESRTSFARTLRKKRYLVPLSYEVKKEVHIPVITIGRLDAKLGEWILKKGKADLVAFNRRILADPDYPNKIAGGRSKETAPCTACLHCLSAQMAGDKVACRINATLVNAFRQPAALTAKQKRVIVVGGGPAGMEAARIAALRGHAVTLYDREHSLGGLLNLAAMIKGTEVENIPSLITYYKVQLQRANVRVNLGVEVTAKLIDDARPDVVVLATGGRLTNPDIPGINRSIVVSNARLHRDSKLLMRLITPEFMRRLTKLYLPFGEKVIIIGGQMQGLELAEFLVKRNRRVVILENSDKIGFGMHKLNLDRLAPWLIEKGVTILSEVGYKEIVDNGIVITTADGEERHLEADSIAIAMPPSSNVTLYEALRDKMPEIYLIGDSREPGNILQAVADGFRTGELL